MNRREAVELFLLCENTMLLPVSSEESITLINTRLLCQMAIDGDKIMRDYATLKANIVLIRNRLKVPFKVDI